MKKTIRLTLAVLGFTLLGACATQKESLALYDLGLLRPLQGAPAPSALPPLSVAEINAPAWLDSQMMFFRLAYVNDQQPRAYSSSRWSMPPAQLFNQRLKSRIGQAGGTVLPASDGAINIPLLRIEADDFTQVFDNSAHSSARVAMRASVFQGRALVAQKTFIRQSPAPTPDASGGVRALADASDAMITEMMSWLAGLPLKK